MRRTQVEIRAEREVKPPRTGRSQGLSRWSLNRSCANIGDTPLLPVRKWGAQGDIVGVDAIHAQENECTN